MKGHGDEQDIAERTRVICDDMMYKQIAPAGNSMYTSVNSPGRESFVETARTGTGNVLWANTGMYPRSWRPSTLRLTDGIDALGSDGVANSNPGLHSSVKVPGDEW